MSKKSDITLRIIKNTEFPKLYHSFLLNCDMSNEKYTKILSLAIIFLNSRNDFVQRLGYRIIVIYCNRTHDYSPLYEVAINQGLIPISKFITDMLIDMEKKSIFFELNDSFSELYRHDKIFRSVEQNRLVSFYNENYGNTVTVIAPTSYGKTDLIISTIQECANKNICIVTPTKSLLAQTKTRIMNAKISWVKKIITHPEMYNVNDTNVVAVLTQERLLRLLQKSPELSFNYIIVDEAHGILNNDSRNNLLASVIILSEKRNKQTVFKFLTPFSDNADNLKVRYTNYTLHKFKVSENLKTENFYIFDTGAQTLKMYDQFFNEFLPIQLDTQQDDIKFIENNKKRKNIIYLNKPSDIEKFTVRLSKRRHNIVSELI